MADNNVLPSSSESTVKLPLRSSLMPYITAAVFATAGGSASAGPEPILGVQSPATQCFDITNLQLAESARTTLPRIENIIYNVNGNAMKLIALRGADNKIQLVLPEERKRTWFAGRCFDQWDGQIYPTYPSPNGQGVTRKNIFGYNIRGVIDEKGKSIGGGYVNVQAAVQFDDEKMLSDNRTVDSSSRNIGGNMDRIIRLILEDTDLNNPDSRDAFIASLLQLQFDLERDPMYYQKSESGKKIGKSIVDFIRKHSHPSFISERDMPKYIELVNRVIALLSK